MPDLRGRFATLDELPVPYLWGEVERRVLDAPSLERAIAVAGVADEPRLPRATRSRAGSLGLVGMLLLLAAAIAATALVVGSIGRQQVAPVDVMRGVFLPTGPMTHERSDHVAVALGDGRVLVLGGSGGGSPALPDPGRADVYDPTTGRFTPVHSLDGQRLWGHAATSLRDGRVLIVGALDPRDSGRLQTTTWDPVSDAVSTLEPIDLAGDVTATLLQDGRVLLLGAGSAPPLRDDAKALVWDPADGSTADLGLDAPARPWRDFTTALLQDGRVLMLGAFEQTAVDGTSGPDAMASPPAARYYPPDDWVAVVDPATMDIRPVGALAHPRAGASATTLQDGRVLIAGGVGIDDQVFRHGGVDLDDARPAPAEIWDPATETSRVIGSMLEDRIEHTATLLDDGRVLFVGGAVIDADGSIGSPLDIAELFDPATETSAVAATPADARAGHTATRLLDGRILVAGGSGGVPTGALASAELFDPSGAQAP